jgi:hypothetical protein
MRTLELWHVAQYAVWNRRRPFATNHHATASPTVIVSRHSSQYGDPYWSRTSAGVPGIRVRFVPQRVQTRPPSTDQLWLPFVHVLFPA